MSKQVPPRAPDLWDRVIRISHWALAAVVLVNALVTQGGSALHLWVGWAGMALLSLRMVWGLIGPLPARFRTFPPRPIAALRHLGQLWHGRPGHYPSHNPAGAMMAYALWASLACVIGTGLLMNPIVPWKAWQQEQILLSGDWSALAYNSALAKNGKNAEQDEDASDGATISLRSVHEFFANAILLLALIHIAGVGAEMRAMRRNLIAPMLLGAAKTRK